MGKNFADLNGILKAEDNGSNIKPKFDEHWFDTQERYKIPLQDLREPMEIRRVFWEFPNTPSTLAKYVRQAVAVGALWSIILADPHVVAEESLDYSCEAGINDNFLQADFRMIVPKGVNAPSAIVVFVPGTDGDGRGIVTNPEFLAIAKACNAILLGCDYRAEGLGYDNPAGGSGHALDQAIFHLADSARHPEWMHLPLLLIGYSQGGIFTFNYVCWRPERVKAFAALKAVSPKVKPGTDSFQVPGLLLAGELDEPGRVRSIARAFYMATGRHSKWTFLLENGMAHELDSKSIEFAGMFLEGVSGKSPETPVYYNAETGKLETISPIAPGICWIPSEQVADAWRTLHKPMRLQDLMVMPDRIRLASLVSVESDPPCYDCEAGAQQNGVLRLRGTNPGITIDRTELVGREFAIGESRSDTLPMDVGLFFTPKSCWGPVTADVEIYGRLQGQMLESRTLKLSGVIEGPLRAIPSTVYLGVMRPGGENEAQVRLKSDHRQFRISKITGSKDITAVLENQTQEGAVLHIRCMPGNRLGQMSSEILLTIDSPEHGTLRIPVIGIVSE
jgi:hypothetical protein